MNAFRNNINFHKIHFILNKTKFQWLNVDDKIIATNDTIQRSLFKMATTMISRYTLNREPSLLFYAFLKHTHIVKFPSFFQHSD